MFLDLDTQTGIGASRNPSSAFDDRTSISSRAQREIPSETSEISRPASGVLDRSQMPHLAPISAAKIARMRSEVQKNSVLVVMQSWEGFVVERDDVAGTFRARLNDLTDKAHLSEEEAVFDLKEVDSDDQELIQVGGVFRWLIGYRDFSYGKRERVSGIRFRRLPSWTKAELERAKDEASALANALHWD